MYANDPGTGFTLWLTGMPLAGKHTLAKALTERLRRLEKPVELIDGGDWEVFLGEGPGSTKEERNAIARRAGFFARTVTRAGGFAVVPQISPYREMRDQLRREIGRFLEVYVDCPFETLMARDPKGLYLKAIAGEFPNFIGVTDPYEYPFSPEVKLDTSTVSTDAAVMQVLEALVREGALTPEEVGLDRAPRKDTKKPVTPSGPGTILFTPEMLRMPRATSKAANAAKPTAPAKSAAVKAEEAKVAAKNDGKKPEAKASTAKTSATARDAKAEPQQEEAKKTTPKPVGKTAAKPATTPAPVKAPVKLAAKAAAKSATKAAAKPAAKAAAKPAAKAAAKPAAKPASKPAAKAAVKPAAKPASKAAAKKKKK